MPKILINLILIIASLSTTISVKAEIPANEIDYNLSPRKLVTLAHHGKFKAQGIPSHSNLNSSIRSGKVTAEQLVKIAIEQNRLPKASLSDLNYLETVKKHLKSGGCGSV